MLTLVALMIHVYNDTGGSKISCIRTTLDSSNFQKQSLKSLRCDKRRVNAVQCEPTKNYNSLTVSILSCKGGSSEKEKCSSSGQF